MNHDEAYAHELMLERYRRACDALIRCAQAGADIEAIRILALECGVDMRHLKLGEKHAAEH